MEHHLIQTYEDFKCLQKYVSQNKFQPIKVETNVVSIKDENFKILIKNEEVSKWIKTFDTSDLIFGKDTTTNIVSCEIDNGSIELFIEKDGIVTSKFIENKYWMVSPKRFDVSWKPLKGNLYYQYIKYYTNLNQYYVDKNRYKDNTFSVGDSKEAAMLLNGFTYFKGMKVSEVSSLFFDIEATGLTHNDSSKVLLISNTFIKNGVTTRKLFTYDDYETEAEFFDAWCNWVKEINPSIICGHNIFSYDLPYMNFCAKKAGTSLNLGRNNTEIVFSKKESKFRKDGSQDYEYKRCFIYGREIVDTMFLAYHFDFSRKYESYALKQIIKQEGLEVENRQFYDASQISENYLIPEEWEKIKKYAEHDADDAKALYDLMIPAYFYLTQSIPKSFQAINYTATGSQINAFLIRSYLQEGHSLPKASEAHRFPGAISLGNPGIYKNCWKQDVASLYPSIILQYNVYDKEKDPNQNFLKMVQYFTKERLTNKKKAKETNDRYYKELEQSQKIVANSSYGLLGASGLLFNSPTNAANVTNIGREILKKAILWASGQEYIEKKNEETLEINEE